MQLVIITSTRYQHLALHPWEALADRQAGSYDPRTHLIDIIHELLHMQGVLALLHRMEN
jgi:hypothetical protein